MSSFSHLRICSCILLALFSLWLVFGIVSRKSSGSLTSWRGDEPAPLAGMPRKAVVGSTWGEGMNKTRWVEHNLPDWELYSYTYTTETLPIEGNVSRLENANGREASTYLSYIIEHYDDLPDYMVFIHGPRYQAHNDEPMYDTLPLISNLNLSYVQAQGYTPLVCIFDKGCLDDPWHPVLGQEDDFWSNMGLTAELYHHIWPGKPVPKDILTSMGGQFAVSRACVLQNDRELYMRIRDFLYDSHESHYKLGIVMELLWHILFGKEPVNCGFETAQDCYCHKWGICNIECTEHRCKGRVWQPPLFGGLPKNWPEEGQGTENWPVDGWWDHLDDDWNYKPPVSLGSSQEPPS